MKNKNKKIVDTSFKDWLIKDKNGDIPATLYVQKNLFCPQQIVLQLFSIEIVSSMNLLSVKEIVSLTPNKKLKKSYNLKKLISLTLQIIKEQVIICD